MSHARLLTLVAGLVAAGCADDAWSPTERSAAGLGPGAAHVVCTDDNVLTGIWEGSVNLEAPGFAGPPVDRLVIDVGDLAPQAFAFEKFPQRVSFEAFPPTDTPGTVRFFAGTGTLVPLAQARTDSAFDVRYRITSGEGAGASDFTERLTGELRDCRLALTYTITGRLYGAEIDGRASGLLTRRGSRPPIPSALAGALWSGEVDLSAPGFAGPPRNRLTVGFHPDGRLSFVGYSSFLWGKAFGDHEGVFPLAGAATVNPTDTVNSYDATVTEAVWSGRSFRFQLHVRSEFDDYVEKVTGELGADGLEVDHTLRGRFYGAAIDARARGRLIP